MIRNKKRYVAVATVAAIALFVAAVLFFTIPTKSYVDFLVAMKGKNQITWDDFDRFPHTDIGSGQYVLEYHLAGGSHLYLAGPKRNSLPEHVYIVDKAGKKIDIR